MLLNLEERCGLPVIARLDVCDLIIDDRMNQPTYRTRMLYDLNPVWARTINDENRIIYKYTSGLWLQEDEHIWKNANIIYGIVMFTPGVFGGEYNKSSGQYHPIVAPNKQATPEIYTVLHGTGHFLLQKAIPPYEYVEDAVMVVVEEGESFIVPPDYGHLQINPSKEPLIFSYAVMDGMNGVYEPFQKKNGAIYYEMAEEGIIFNPKYAQRVPLRFINAAQLDQIALMENKVTYQLLKKHINELEFLVNPAMFPQSAAL